MLVFLRGWSRNSKFSLLGGVRAAAQMVSYEVIFSFGFLLFMVWFFRFNICLNEFIPWNRRVFFLCSVIPLLLIIILAETNRTPFDLTEGESELVRGFNTEFSAIQFVLLFLGEYSFICFFRFLLRKIVFRSFGLFLRFLFVIV